MGEEIMLWARWDKNAIDSPSLRQFDFNQNGWFTRTKKKTQSHPRTRVIWAEWAIPCPEAWPHPLSHIRFSWLPATGVAIGKVIETEVAGAWQRREIEQAIGIRASWLTRLKPRETGLDTD
jgi:hypothetical protein